MANVMLVTCLKCHETMKLIAESDETGTFECPKCNHRIIVRVGTAIKL